LHLRDIDLNLLVILHELLNQHSVSKAATKLGMSQPAVSNALNRLRKVIGDDLFMRTSRGIVPTPFAENLRAPLAHALLVLQDAVNTVANFDSATTVRQFRIAMTDVGQIHFLPQLISMLGHAGPGISIDTIRLDTVDLKSEMESGVIDLAFGFLPDLQFEFFQRRLFSQNYVCLMRKDNPLSTTQLDLDAFEGAEHLSVLAEGTGHSRVEAILNSANIKRKIKLRVPNFFALGYILQSTDLIAVVPEAYAIPSAPIFGLITKPCPVELPEITINILWHSQNHRDAGNQWLRNLIAEQFLR
jgi:DNA-binding transcriptional LysR family regulator